MEEWKFFVIARFSSRPNAFIIANESAYSFHPSTVCLLVCDFLAHYRLQKWAIFLSRASFQTRSDSCPLNVIKLSLD